jgi:NADH-quinone oxidoreductase subunit H
MRRLTGGRFDGKPKKRLVKNFTNGLAGGRRRGIDVRPQPAGNFSGNFTRFMDAYLIASIVKTLVMTLLVILPLVALSSLAERKVSAFIQDRVGPNRVGIPATLFGAKRDIPLFGLIQPLADGLKFLLKEDLTPKHVRKFYFWLAPVLTMVPALLTVAVLPFGSYLNIGGDVHKMVIADLNVGPLFTFAIASLGVYGIVIAGWSSNSKYSFLGGVRSSSQMISYEISMGLSIIPVLMVFGELNLGKIVAEQDANGWLLLPMWGDGWSWQRWLLLVPMAISFIIFTVSIFAETNRMPFDLPECETELVAGYHTEYSSMKFAMFFMGEYAAMIIGSGLVVTLFLGGWSIPFVPSGDFAKENWWMGFLHMGCFLTKVVAFIFFFMWVRWTLPRFRFDQLMRLGWIFFFELALANVFLTALILMFVN